MELPVVLAGAHRSSEGGLARRTHEAAGLGRCGVHPAAARSAGQPGGDADLSSNQLRVQCDLGPERRARQLLLCGSWKTLLYQMRVPNTRATLETSPARS